MTNFDNPPAAIFESIAALEDGRARLPISRSLERSARAISNLRDYRRRCMFQTGSLDVDSAVGDLKNILLADDSPDDVFLIRSGFKKGGFQDPIYDVSNGEHVLQYLKGEGPYADRKQNPIPHLLLLDLNMPRLNGFEVLSWIRGRKEWMCLPVIVLTTSFYGPEIKRAYDLGANSFITKPPEFAHLVASLKEVGEHWLRRAILPEPGPFIPSPTQNPTTASKTRPLGRAKSAHPRETRNPKSETRNKLEG